MSNLLDAYLSFWKQYTDVHSLSNLTKFWTPTIVNAVIVAILESNSKLTVLALLFDLAILVPSICVFIRRMHDAGASAKLFWMGLIPIAGVFFQSMVFLIELMPSNYYNTNFFAWKDRETVNESASLTWMWVVASIITVITLMLYVVCLSAILALVAMVL